MMSIHWSFNCHKIPGCFYFSRQIILISFLVVLFLLNVVLGRMSFFIVNNRYVEIILLYRDVFL